MDVWDFLPNMALALKHHLIKDKEKWGDTWLDRTREGQEKRVWQNYTRKFRAYFDDGTPIDWLSIIGDAMICWIREKYPEIWEK